MRRRRSRNRGFMLLGVYTLIAASLMGLNVFSMRAVTQSAHTARYIQSTQALDLARAGVEHFREDLYRFLYDRVYLGAANADAGAAMGWLDQLETASGGGALESPVFDPYDDPSDADPPVRKLPFSSAALPWPTAPGTSFTVTLAANDPVRAGDDSGVDTCQGQRVCDIVVVSTAQVAGVTKTIQATLRFSLQPSEAFKYLYFINNYGYFSGNPARHDIRIHGDLRANGDLSIGYVDWVNGDVFAAANSEAINPDTGAPSTGAITLTHVDSLDSKEYVEHSRTNANKMRPHDPYRLDTPLDLTLRPYDPDDPSKGYFDGYKGSIGQHGGGAAIPMPAMGDLALYRALADAYPNKEGGTGSLLRYWDDGPDGKPGTSDDKYVTITGVYDGIGDTYRQNDATWDTPQPLSPYGPDGVQGTADDGTLVLGTRYFDGVGGNQRPAGSSFSIDGPVVIPNDAVVIGGTQQGQGIVYAGRNVHITNTIWRSESDIPYYPAILKCTGGGGGVTYRVDCLDKSVPDNSAPKTIIEPSLATLETRVTNECH